MDHGSSEFGNRKAKIYNFGGNFEPAEIKSPGERMKVRGKFWIR